MEVQAPRASSENLATHGALALLAETSDLRGLHQLEDWAALAWTATFLLEVPVVRPVLPQRLQAQVLGAPLCSVVEVVGAEEIQSVQEKLLVVSAAGVLAE